MKGTRKNYSETLKEDFPEELRIALGTNALLYRKRLFGSEGLRYGDNPGQKAAFYTLESGSELFRSCTVLSQGKQVSKNNLTDIDSGLNILKHFDEPAAIVVKHSNPCGAASRASIGEAFHEALMADKLAAFGGAAVVNRTVDSRTAEEMAANYLEAVCAPSFEPKALETLSAKKNIRIVEMKGLELIAAYRSRRHLEMKALTDGSLILQESALLGSPAEYRTAEAEISGERARTREPTPKEREDMLFAWKIVQGCVSNAVVFGKDKATVAIGCGEQDRVGAVDVALLKAYKKLADRLSFEMHGKAYWEIPEQEKKLVDSEVERRKGGLSGSVLASDGFFPFRDSIDAAARHGVTAAIQPGGAMRDADCIEACRQHQMAMLFTGERAFRH